MSDKLSVIQSALADTDLSLRKRLSEIGVDLPHMFVAIGPNGDIMIQGELGTGDLQRLAKAIGELAEKAILDRSMG